MLDQFKGIVGLKLYSIRHGWTRSSKRLSNILTVLTVVGIVTVTMVLGAATFMTGWFGGAELAGEDPDMRVLWVLLGGDVGVLALLFVWSVLVLADLQQANLIDLRKILHLPIAFKTLYLTNYAASLFGPFTFFFLIPFAALCVGLSVHMGPAMVLGIPLAVAFYFMLTAWTYFAKGFLAIAMENKRRRRLIMIGAPLLLGLLGWVPMLVMMNIDSDLVPSDVVKRVISGEIQIQNFHLALPPAWLPLGLSALLAGLWGEALLCFLGLCCMGGIGLAVGYRVSARFYLGTGRGRSKPQPQEKQSPDPGRHRPLLAAWRIPFTDDQTSAVAMATLLTYLRHPVIRTTVLGLTILMVVGAVYAMGNIEGLTAGKRLMAPFATAAAPFLFCGMIYLNFFGFDCEGFGAYVLLSTRRRKILVGKNLAALCITGAIATVTTAIGAVLFGYSTVILVIALLQVLQLNLVFCMVGNLVSLYFPYRINIGAGWGSARKGQWIMILVSPILGMVLMLLLLPSALGFAADYLARQFLAYEGISLGLLFSIATLTVTIFLYRFSLGPTEKLLLKREQKILASFRADRE